MLIDSPSQAAVKSDADVGEINLSSQFWVKKSVFRSGGVLFEGVGGIILTDGDNAAIKAYIDKVSAQSSNEILYYRQFSLKDAFALSEETKDFPQKLLTTATPETLKEFGHYLGQRFKEAGLVGCLVNESSLMDENRFRHFLNGLEEQGMKVHSGHYGGVSMLEKDQSERLVQEKKPKRQFQSFEQTKDIFIHPLMEDDPWLINWLNHDVLILEEEQIEALDQFQKKIKSNKWYRKIAEKKHQKNLLWTKKDEESLQNITTEWPSVAHDLLKESFVLLKNDDNIPFASLEERFVFIGDEYFAPLLKSMSRYSEVPIISWTQYDNSPGYAFTELGEADQVIVAFRKREDLKVIKKQLGDHLKMTILTDELDKAGEALEFGSVVFFNGTSAGQQDMAGQILFGGMEAKGYIPRNAGRYFKEKPGITTRVGDRLAYEDPEVKGFDQAVLKKIDGIVQQSIKEGAFPGCQIAIVKGSSLVYEQAFGYFTYDSLHQVRTEDLYDLASVTKVVGTLQAVMFLQEQGLIDLEEKLGTYLPELMGSNKANLVVRDVLLHEAGLKPYLPFWRVTIKKDHLDPYIYLTPEDSVEDIRTYDLHFTTPEERKTVWEEVISSDLRKLRKGDTTYSYKYSDLSFLLLQKLVEQVSNQPLDEFLSQNVYQPLGLKHTLFNPLVQFNRDQIAPTEYDYYFRNAQVWGTVHDQNAQVLGGVAGHAGLFSNANDLAKILQMNLNGGQYGGYRFLHGKTLDFFSRQQNNDNRRGLGWDKPGVKEHNTSTAASTLTYGHTGFTGTAVWVDPKYDLIYVFLANRVYPSVKNRKLMENNIRIKIQDVIYEAMGIKI